VLREKVEAGESGLFGYAHKRSTNAHYRRARPILRRTLRGDIAFGVCIELLDRCEVATAPRFVGCLWIILQATPLTQESGRLGAEGGELLVDDDEPLFSELQAVVGFE
jgi:hypothetical protein